MTSILKSATEKHLFSIEIISNMGLLCKLLIEILQLSHDKISFALLFDECGFKV